MIRWTKPFALPEGIDEDPYKSYLTQHGYATNTPISDGQSVFLYLGKLGLYAFDLDGNQLWHRPVKSEINETRWGSAASLIFYKDSLIVNAVEENGHIYSMSKTDGALNWEFDTKATLVYATPNLLTTKTGEMELVVPVPEKVYGVDPDSGQQKWFVTTTLKNEMNKIKTAYNKV